MRISQPTYTQTPNDLFDHWLPLLKESELKVLLVIMRKTFGWHKVRDRISISQLARLTGLTEETVVIATKSLQKKGVILKQVVGELGKQQTFYELIVEDSNNSYPSENPRSKETPLGFDGGGESEAQKKSPIPKEKEQQQGATAPAAVSSKKAKKQKAEIYPCLESIEIPEKEKEWLTKTHDEEAVQYAIAWATHPQTKIDTTLVQVIKWACAARPEMPKDQKDEVEANKEGAKQYDDQSNEYARINALSKCVEIIPHAGQSGGIYIEYSERDFATKFEEARKKYRFIA